MTDQISKSLTSKKCKIGKGSFWDDYNKARKKLQWIFCKIQGFPERESGRYGVLRKAQKATALAAATFKESTPWAIGIFTV